MTDYQPKDSEGKPALTLWMKKNLVTLELMQSCLSDKLIALTTNKTNVFQIWQMLKLQMSQKGSGSIMLWFCQLTSPMNLGFDISEHIVHFQEVLHHLTIAKWNSEANQINKTSTTSATINILLDEKHCCATANVTKQQKQEFVMALLDHQVKSHGKLYCSNCHKKTNHIAADCWASSGRKEDQDPKKKKPNTRGKTKKHDKGKKKAQHATDDVFSEEEDFNTTTSHYDTSNHIENPVTKDQGSVHIVSYHY
ncbi:uncharacterized protein EV420DRAFT_1476891 [Desarmillaria tabescens]|uniref:Uncharacterized protein n=1 Tax=Armillaria tabescens TaxID=1929756 RepID=A0AA39T434_ARMTA|nr:uncharacterized protein EV420DRAFT_1476891 [Desarmillaria tabescens]KAK0463166.1 hypothetical protein EV420DRAFT_1476891 [Desarmillaria tabescens]